MLGVVSITFKGENVLRVRHIDVEEHYLSQVGVLTAQWGVPVISRLFNPTQPHLPPSHPVTFHLWSYHSLEREREGINKRALPPVKDFAPGPPSPRQAGRKLFRCASQWFVSLVVSPWPWGSPLWPQNTDPRHKEETGSVTFHELTPTAPQSLFHFRGDPSFVRPEVYTMGA